MFHRQCCFYQDESGAGYTAAATTFVMMGRNPFTERPHLRDIADRAQVTGPQVRKHIGTTDDLSLDFCLNLPGAPAAAQ